MIFLALLTLGLSQEDSTQICLPEEQIRALFEDAQYYTLCEQTLHQLDYLILEMDSIIIKQDSIIFVLEQQVALQDSVLQEAIIEYMWWEKPLYLILGILSGKFLLN